MLSRMKALIPVLVLCGCSASPEGFVNEFVRQHCRFSKRCDRAVWNELRFGSVGDCVDDALSEDDVDDFAAACDDYDPERGRKCLAGLREAVRACDEDAASAEQEESCARVCGSPIGLDDG